MKVSEMLKLAKEGMTAADILILNKAGFTPEIIEELSNESGPSLEDIKAAEAEAEEKRKAEAEEKRKAEAEETKRKEEAEAEKELLMKENETLKKQILDLQGANRGRDISGDLPPKGSDIDNIIDKISSVM